MIIIFKNSHTESDREKVINQLRIQGAKPQLVKFGSGFALVIGDESLSGPKVDYLAFPFVDQVITNKIEYPKISKQNFGPQIIRANGVEIGAGRTVVIAGPCAVESEDQMLRIAFMVKSAGAQLLRGGAYKPRTSPYKFQGHGKEGLEILKRTREATGLGIVTEALDIRDLEAVADVADIVQIGTRNMQNFPLLKEVGKLRKPVLLKRGMSATIQEWLLAAEYIADGGNREIILCERGVRSFDTETRNLLDLSVIPVLKQKTNLPVAIDPSHGTGRNDAVEPMALAAVAAGANVIMIEAHDQPEFALSDGFQAMIPEQLRTLITKIEKVATAVGSKYQRLTEEKSETQVWI